MDILMVCGVFGEGTEAAILEKTKGPAQFAANALQWGIVRGLDALNTHPVQLLSGMFVGSYPTYYRDIVVPSGRWAHAPGAADVEIGFLNLFGIKHLVRSFAIAREARRWARRSVPGEEERVIIIYSLHSPFLYGALQAKACDPRIRICVIVPDLPQFMALSPSRNPVRVLLKWLDARLINGMLKRVDGFVLLTKAMANALGVGVRPWVVVEGIADRACFRQTPGEQADVGSERIVLYSGTLTKCYGIMTLLTAFALIRDAKYRLWICGAGEAKSDIERLCASDPRIRYFGQVTRDDVLDLQKKATVLINPRGPAGEFTEFSFPSKILEYMSSGTPTLIQRLPGIPAEYFDHVFMISEDTPESVAAGIVHVCELPEEDRRKRGEEAQIFVASNKNCVVQATKIFQLLKEM